MSDRIESPSTSIPPSSSNCSLEHQIVDINDDAGSRVYSLKRKYWLSTSMHALAAAEAKVLACVRTKLNTYYSDIKNSAIKIWTVHAESQENNEKSLPLVMLHGMGGGSGLWVNNYVALSKSRSVYSLDLVGFGKSTRHNFSSNPYLSEIEYVESIELWRQNHGFNKMVLLGHSFGAYLASAYAMRYPKNINLLILVDPWGFVERKSQTVSNLPIWAKALGLALKNFNPLASLRAAGPLGPGMITKFRPDLINKFNDVVPNDVIIDYLYHCNTQQPTGEKAFRMLSSDLGWAKFPMIRRMDKIPTSVDIAFIFGSRSWVDPSCGRLFKEFRESVDPQSYTSISSIKGAGHHVYADQPEDFNRIVNTLCLRADAVYNKLDNTQPTFRL